VKGLVLGRGGHVAVRHQVVQEGLDVVFIEGEGVVSWQRAKRAIHRTYAVSVR
jgi:hypothetical protein